LLNKRKVEGNRIEFKKGWNPAEIYATFETTEDRLTFLIHIPVHAGSEKTTETATEKIVRLIRENPQITNKELAAA
jgi:hypothetical protein